MCIIDSGKAAAKRSSPESRAVWLRWASAVTGGDAENPATRLRNSGLSGAKVLAMNDLAAKKRFRVVPTHEEALKLYDEGIGSNASFRVRGIGWTLEMF